MYVMLDDGPPENGKVSKPMLAVAHERIRGLVELVAFLQEQLELERQRSAELVNELKAGQKSPAQERRSPWWRFWQGSGDGRRRTPHPGGNRRPAPVPTG